MRGRGNQTERGFKVNPPLCFRKSLYFSVLASFHII